jgi:ABC-type phosphate transport system permease subunit
MEYNEKEYMKNESNDLRMVRTEILFTPLLVILPLIVAGFLIYDWYCRGFSQDSSLFNGELMLGIIILVANITFDVPFIKSLIKFKKK